MTKTAKEVSKEAENEKPLVTLVAGSENWNFNEAPEFVGRLIGPNMVTLKDDEGNEKETKRFGFVFEDEDGETWILPDWTDIIRALEARFKGPDGEETTVEEMTKSPLIKMVYKGEAPSKKGAPRKMMVINIIAW